MWELVSKEKWFFYRASAISAVNPLGKGPKHVLRDVSRIVALELLTREMHALQ